MATLDWVIMALVLGGQAIARGTVLGTVGDAEVRSAFAGDVQGFLALPGERVTARQPIAWLRQK